MKSRGKPPKTTSRRVRLKDVAEMAGVAVNTASTILNRNPNSWASQATVERVFAAAKELGYRPNRAAVALQSGRFNSIGLLVPDLSNPYFTHIASLLGELVEQSGYDLVIESWRNDLEREHTVLREFVNRNIDGVIVFVSNIAGHREFFERQATNGVPVAVLAMPEAGEAPVDMVMPDFEPGLREAAETLHRLGHRRFAFLDARAEGHRVGKRPGLLREILAGLEGAELEVHSCGPEVSAARDVAATMLGGDSRPTAVISLNDYTAIGVMRAAADAGLAVPKDLSVVGIDGVPVGEQLMVSLSTVVQPHMEMTTQVLDFLQRRINGDDSPPHRKRFTTRFVERESSGPPGSAG